MAARDAPDSSSLVAGALGGGVRGGLVKVGELWAWEYVDNVAWLANWIASLLCPIMTD